MREPRGGRERQSNPGRPAPFDTVYAGRLPSRKSVRIIPRVLPNFPKPPLRVLAWIWSPVLPDSVPVLSTPGKGGGKRKGKTFRLVRSGRLRTSASRFPVVFPDDSWFTLPYFYHLLLLIRVYRVPRLT